MEGAVAADAADEDFPVLDRRRRDTLDRPKLYAILADNFAEHQCVPVNLGKCSLNLLNVCLAHASSYFYRLLRGGLGFTSVQDKCSACLYAIYMDTGWETFAPFTDSMVSTTTDMGTELSMSEFGVDPITLLPRWLQASRLEHDYDDAIAGATQR